MRFSLGVPAMTSPEVEVIAWGWRVGEISSSCPATTPAGEGRPCEVCFSEHKGAALLLRGSRAEARPTGHKHSEQSAQHQPVAGQVDLVFMLFHTAVLCVKG